MIYTNYIIENNEDCSINACFFFYHLFLQNKTFLDKICLDKLLDGWNNYLNMLNLDKRSLGQTLFGLIIVDTSVIIIKKPKQTSKNKTK